MGKSFFVLKLSAAAVCLALLAACAATAKTGGPPPWPSGSSAAQIIEGNPDSGSYFSLPPSGGEPISPESTASALEKTLATIGNNAQKQKNSGSSSAALPSSRVLSGGSPTAAPVGASSVQRASSTPSQPVASVAPPASGSSAAAVPLPFSHPAKLVVAYYGAWSAYSGFTPDMVSGSNLNILHYAFAKIGTDCRVTAGDSSIDYRNFTALKTLKSKNAGLRTVISIGGWSDSGRFSDAALTKDSRDAFADSAVSFMKANGFDGVDIDWEYPTGGGLSTNVTRTADKTNFGLLLSVLRSKLDAQGIRDGKHYILSFAGGAGSGYAAGLGLAGIAKTVDYGIIMTYDLHGSWDTFTDFNAPLYTPTAQSPQYRASVDSSVRAWLNNGFPAGKLVLGVPFYGYVYRGVSGANNGLWQRFSSGTAVGFDSIRSKYLSGAAYGGFYDSTAQVPWLYGNSVFVSYDNEASIQRKAQYAVSKGLLGVGAWELGFDKNAILLHTVKNTLG